MSEQPLHEPTTLQDSAACHADACHTDACHTGPPTLQTAVQATLHCLTGCAIGEIAGLSIAMWLGLGVWPTIALATTLAYISGFTLGLRPVMRNRGVSMREAFRIIWLGEVVSIGVMEIAMNATDYAAGGMHAQGFSDPIFWIAMVLALGAGFLAALPVNWWLLSRNLKNCH